MTGRALRGLRPALRWGAALAVFALASGVFLVSAQRGRYQAAEQRFQYRPKGYADFWMPVTVDWTRGTITARGYGAVPLAARTNAYGLINLYVNGVPAADPDTGCKLLDPAGDPDRDHGLDACRNGLAVDSERFVNEIEQFRGRVSAMIRGGREVGHGEETYQGRTLTWVEIQVPIKGAQSLTNLLFELPGDADEDEAGGIRFDPLDEDFLFRSIIVDARGRGLNPALAPRIVAEDGTVLYEPSMVDPAAAAANGFVTYVTAPTESGYLDPGMRRAWAVIAARIALADELIIPGRRLATNDKDVVVSAEAAQQLMASDQGRQALRSGGVIIVADMAVGAAEGRRPIRLARLWP